MPLNTTIGQLAANDVLPEDLRDYDRVMDKKGIRDLLQAVAERHPERYRDVSRSLIRLGKDVSYQTGGYSFGLQDLLPSLPYMKARAALERKIDAVLDDPDTDDDYKEGEVIKATSRAHEGMDKAVLAAAVAQRNPLAMQVLSGARGSATSLKTLIGADGLYQDHRDRVIPFPILNSYSQGLTPAEFFAGSFGARKGLINSKMAVAEGGFLCLAEGTMVRKPDGSCVAIETIKVNDLVVGADRYGRTFPVRVTNTFRNGPKEVWRYVFLVGKSRSGFISIEATENHKVLAKIKQGRLGVTYRNRPDGSPKSIHVPTCLPLSRSSRAFRLVPAQGELESGGVHEPYALMLGLLIGNGGLTTNKVMFSTGDEGLIGEMNRRYWDHGFWLEKCKGKDYEYRVMDLDPYPREFGQPNGYRHRLREWLDGHQMLGCLAHEKHIPKEVYLWNRDSVADLIAGIYETDGCVTLTNNSTVPAVILAMTSRAVIDTVRDLLAFRFGIHSCPSRRTPKEKFRLANHDLHTTVINDRDSVLRFHQAIRLPGRKQAILDNLVSRMGDRVRADEFLYSFVRKEFIGIRLTHDIEVNHPDHLFVLDNGAIVSNSKQLVEAAHWRIESKLDADRPEALVEDAGVNGLARHVGPGRFWGRPQN
jgi:hypothetical protein